MRRLATLIASLVALITALVLALTDGRPTALDRQAVDEWLGCERCVRGPPGSIAVRFSYRAVPLLEDALYEIPERIRSEAEAELRAAWAMIPQPSLTEDAFVDRYMGTTRSRVQLRAVMALGDLGEADILTEARDLHARGGVAFDADVFRELTRALAYTGPGLAPDDPASLEILPGAMTLVVGQTAHLRAVARSTAGDDVSETTLALWTSSNPAIVGVVQDPPLGVIATALDNGSADLRAEAHNGVDETVTITVVAPGTDALVKVSGDPQTDTVGDTLAPFVVRVERSGSPIGGITVTWTVLRGGVFLSTGTGSTTSVSDNTTGEASATLILGATPGPYQVRAAITGDTETFSGRIVPP